MSVSMMMIAMMLLATMSIAQAQNFKSSCGIGRPQSWGGDIPNQVWLREMRLCNEQKAKVDKLIVRRYPPSDPRKD